MKQQLSDIPTKKKSRHTRVDPRIPAAARESMANGVTYVNRETN